MFVFYTLKNIGIDVLFICIHKIYLILCPVCTFSLYIYILIFHNRSAQMANKRGNGLASSIVELNNLNNAVIEKLIHRI